MTEGNRRTDGGIAATTDRDDAGNDDREPGEASEFVGKDLVIGYPSTDDPVVERESVHVPPGAVTALVGPNGSGKSTLMKGLADQLDLAAGTVLVDGEDVHEMSTKALAKRLGLLSQENVSPDSIAVEKLVGHGRYPHRGFFESFTEEDREAIDRAISMTGIDHLREREVGSLSGGQKQLVWIALVLAQETDVLLLDEPTTFLDVHHQLAVMEVVEALRDEADVTVVLVLHDVEQAARYADHLIALEDGAVYARGPPEEVVTEGLLADVFGVEAAVESTRHGPAVTPLRPIQADGESEESG
jgi:iron complex transport system ATP-binding protein